MQELGLQQEGCKKNGGETIQKTTNNVDIATLKFSNDSAKENYAENFLSKNFKKNSSLKSF